EKVSGSAVYALDVRLPGMVFARTLRSPFPNARITGIDTRKAKNLPGVLYILTHENSPEIKWYDRSLLFDPHVRYEGEEVAVVAAKTDAIAEEALKLIEVNYEELPFVTDPSRAMEEDAPEVYDSGNIVEGESDKSQRGNVEEGFRQADVVIEREYTTPVVIHNPTEVHCSAVNWDGDELTVWDSTQGIFSVRDRVADALKMPESHVRVIKKYMGGGFGSKLEAGKYTVMAAIIARRIGRPVHIALDRKAMNQAVGNRPSSYQRLKGGVKKDGTLTALQHYSYGPAGAYPSGAGCSWPLRSIYKCENVKTEDYTVYINAGKARPFRAPGHVQGIVGLDSLMDELAEEIGMDPLEFRLKNYAEIDQVSNQPYTSKLLKECYRQGAKAIGWDNRRKAGSGNGPLKTGIGMATQIWWGGGSPPAYATINLNRDGSLQVIAGTQDIGTGTYTIIAQVAAEVLEVPMDRIQVILGDTAVCPYGPSSGGSTTAPSISPAVRDAAELMKARLISGAAASLEVPEDQVRYRNGRLSAAGRNGNEMEIGEVVRKMRERVLTVTGARSQNPDGYTINSFGAQFAAVEVNENTGKIRVKKIVAAHDIGRTLNRKLLENQFHGGIMQGLGFALMEERVIDRNTGKVLTTNFHDYKIPTVMDTPEIEVIIVSDGDPQISNTGVKGIGEPAIIPTAGAIANAVYNALGVRIYDLPMTPDRVINALQKARG
ncbi:MAG: xanthine dehydrogenase family protein molybdopterin-binding subunit, partial [Calditrichia bacterium]